MNYLGAYKLGDEPCRVLLLGEDNPVDQRLQTQLFCAPAKCAGWNLQGRILRLPRYRYLSCWRTNLCIGGAWNAATARERAGDLLTVPVHGCYPWDVVVMLGRKVARACAHVLHLEALEPFTSVATHQNLRLVSIPHPSGLCREWNVVGAHDRARDIVRAFAPELWEGPHA